MISQKVYVILNEYMLAEKYNDSDDDCPFRDHYRCNDCPIRKRYEGTCGINETTETFTTHINEMLNEYEEEKQKNADAIKSLTE